MAAFLYTMIVFQKTQDMSTDQEILNINKQQSFLLWPYMIESKCGIRWSLIQDSDLSIFTQLAYGKDKGISLILEAPCRSKR